MKHLALVILTLLSPVALAAGQAKITWSHDGQDITGVLVPITQFTVYWGQQGQPLSNAVQIGPPAPWPWKVVAGVSTYTKTINNAAWQPGLTFCFAMSAWTFSQESSHTAQVCKTFTAAPHEPPIVEIVYP